MSETKPLISYHTFIFPFLFNTGGKTDRARFLKQLPPLGTALCEDRVDWNAVPEKALFDQYRYFNVAARNAIYTERFDPSDIVWNYRYDLEYLFTKKSDKQWLHSRKDADNRMQFVIQQGDFKATLAIHGVRLKLFNTGIGMLAFELENYELAEERDITRINDYGRRTFMPFIQSNTDRTCSSCAENVFLTCDGAVVEAASGAVGAADSSRADRITLAPFITYFLSNDVSIEPITDERMFVACLYVNDAFATDMAAWDDKACAHRFLAHAEALSPDAANSDARRLYEMMFVDGDGITCHSRPLLKQLLEEHIYTRWLECKTVTGITEYSMITVTTRQGFAFTATSFPSEYVEMVYLALAQRASLLAFERAISEIARGNYPAHMDDVQRQYVMFQSQLLLQEVTSQQQGIELYNLLLDNLFINRQQTGIEMQIKSLFEWNTSRNEKAENRILFLLATLGVVECVNTFFGEWFNLHHAILPGIALAIVLVLLLYHFVGQRMLGIGRRRKK